ncbi:glycosyltransferase [Ruminococcus bromii]|nr:glycosyltransferase [Ruminococcus bromii]MTQ94704.1 glycosyltransferase [Ruminococcus bromii]MTR79674.1 glycosyltransferase [Ruminococcus bromii]MTR88920.1 glycosyltransferase [Ruminococcus bromii]
MAKISVAMTTYNGSKYIIKQLDSLKNQSRKIDELVICDDCSTDNTVELVNDYIKSNNLEGWNIYSNENNLGFINNFKQAIKKTTGDIIFLCDQDDEWCVNKISTMTDIIEKNNQVKLLSCSLTFIDENCKPYTPSNIPSWYQKMISTSPEEITPIDFINICNANFAPGCTMCFTREICDKYCNMDYEYELPHDWLIALIASVDNGYYHLNTSLINYRIHSSNAIGVSKAKNSQNNKQQIKRLNSLKNRLHLAKKFDYHNMTLIDNCLKYVESRIELYENRSFCALKNVLKTSTKAKKMEDKIIMVNIKDIFYFMHIIF